MFKNGDFVWDRHTLSTPTQPKLFDLFRCFPPSGCVHDSSHRLASKRNEGQD